MIGFDGFMERVGGGCKMALWSRIDGQESEFACTSARTTSRGVHVHTCRQWHGEIDTCDERGDSCTRTDMIGARVIDG